jgi:hypothetical protein
VAQRHHTDLLKPAIGADRPMRRDRPRSNERGP